MKYRYTNLLTQVLFILGLLAPLAVTAAQPSVPALFGHYGETYHNAPYLQIPFQAKHLLQPALQVPGHQLRSTVFTKLINNNMRELEQRFNNNSPAITAQYLIVDLYANQQDIPGPSYNVVFHPWALQQRIVAWGETITLKAGLLDKRGVRSGEGDSIALNQLADIAVNPHDGAYSPNNGTVRFDENDQIAFFWACATYPTPIEQKIAVFPTLLSKNQQLHEVLQGQQAQAFFNIHPLNVRKLKVILSMLYDETYGHIFVANPTENEYVNFIYTFTEAAVAFGSTIAERTYYETVRAARNYFATRHSQKDVLKKAAETIDLLFTELEQQNTPFPDFTYRNIDQAVAFDPAAQPRATSATSPATLVTQRSTAQIPPVIQAECILCNNERSVIQLEGDARTCFNCLAGIRMTVVRDDNHHRTGQVGVLNPATRSIIPAEVFAHYNVNPSTSLQEDIPSHIQYRPEVEQLGETVKQTGQISNDVIQSLVNQIGELTLDESAFLTACQLVYEDRQLARTARENLLREIQSLNPNFTGSGTPENLLVTNPTEEDDDDDDIRPMLIQPSSLPSNQTEKNFFQLVVGSLRLNPTLDIQTHSAWNRISTQFQQVLRDFQAALITQRQQATPPTAQTNVTTREYPTTITLPTDPTELEYFTVILDALMDDPEAEIEDKPQWSLLSPQSREQIESFQNTIRCSLCMNAFDQDEHAKINLHPNAPVHKHPYCKYCVEHLPADSGTITCPQCNVRITNEVLTTNTVTNTGSQRFDFARHYLGDRIEALCAEIVGQQNELTAIPTDMTLYPQGEATSQFKQQLLGNDYTPYQHLHDLNVLEEFIEYVIPSERLISNHEFQQYVTNVTHPEYSRLLSAIRSLPNNPSINTLLPMIDRYSNQSFQQLFNELSIQFTAALNQYFTQYLKNKYDTILNDWSCKISEPNKQMLRRIIPTVSNIVFREVNVLPYFDRQHSRYEVVYKIKTNLLSEQQRQQLENWSTQIDETWNQRYPRPLRNISKFLHTLSPFPGGTFYTEYRYGTPEEKQDLLRLLREIISILPVQQQQRQQAIQVYENLSGSRFVPTPVRTQTHTNAHQQSITSASPTTPANNPSVSTTAATTPTRAQDAYDRFLAANPHALQAYNGAMPSEQQIARTAFNSQFARGIIDENGNPTALVTINQQYRSFIDQNRQDFRDFTERHIQGMQPFFVQGFQAGQRARQQDTLTTTNASLAYDIFLRDHPTLIPMGLAQHHLSALKRIFEGGFNAGATPPTFGTFTPAQAQQPSVPALTPTATIQPAAPTQDELAGQLQDLIMDLQDFSIPFSQFLTNNQAARTLYNQLESEQQQIVQVVYESFIPAPVSAATTTSTPATGNTPMPPPLPTLEAINAAARTASQNSGSTTTTTPAARPSGRPTAPANPSPSLMDELNRRLTSRQAQAPAPTLPARPQATTINQAPTTQATTTPARPTPPAVAPRRPQSTPAAAPVVTSTPTPTPPASTPVAPTSNSSAATATTSITTHPDPAIDAEMDQFVAELGANAPAYTMDDIVNSLDCLHEDGVFISILGADLRANPSLIQGKIRRRWGQS